MTQYAGNNANYPTDFTIVSDNTDRTASSVNVALTALGDRTAYINLRYMNGVDGGTYSPSSPLNISNLGTLSGAGPLTLTGDIFCDDLQADTMATNQFTMTDAGAGIGHELGQTYARINTDLTFKQTTSKLISSSTRSATLVLQGSFYHGLVDPVAVSVPSVPTTVNVTTTPWLLTSGSLYTQRLIDTGVGRRLFANIPTLPRSCTITLARVYVRGATGHGVLPASNERFQFALYKQPKAGGATVTVFAQTADASGTIAAYETYHSITLTGSEVYTPSTHRYYFEITGEKGANYLANGEVYMIELIYTYTTLAE